MKKHNLNKILALTMITSMLGGMSVTAADAEPITLRFSWWGGDTRHEMTVKALELYHELNPNVIVEGEYGGWDGYTQKLYTQIAGGAAPDIISIPDVEAYNLMAQNVLTDLQDGSLVDLSVFDQNLFEKITKDGGIYGVPVNNALDFTGIVNVDFFEKFDIPVDTVWTYDNVLEIGTRVHEEDEECYLINSSNDILSKFFEYYIMQKTGELMVSSDFVLQCTEEDIVESLNMLKTFQDAGVFQPLSESALFGSFENPKWANGNVGISYDPSTTLATYEGDATKTLDITNMIVKSDGKDTFLGGSTNMFLGISATSEHKEEAAAFIDWFFNSEEALMVLQESRGVQPTENGRNILSEAGLGDPLASKAITMASEVGGTTPLLWVGGDEIRKIESDVIQGVLLDMYTPEEGTAMYLDLATVKFDELRAEAGL